MVISYDAGFLQAILEVCSLDVGSDLSREYLDQNVVCDLEKTSACLALKGILRPL